jgi:CubicO group peptidase (beta-lactamase class C family)
MNNSTTLKEKVPDRLILPTKTEHILPPAMVGAAGIYSSVEDLAKYSKVSFDASQRALNLMQQETLVKKTLFEETIMGLAWGISHEGFTETIYTHAGNIGGYASFIVLDVKNKNGIIILSHQSSFYDNEPNDIVTLSMELIEIMYNKGK